VNQLSLEEISAAWAYLAHSPTPEQPQPLLPPSLKNLSPRDWTVLSQLLQQELMLKDCYPLH
jgi:hypothetical protein